MIPEPFVSTALSAENDAVKELFDMNRLWEDATGQAFPMGVLVAQKSFVEEKADDLAVFLKDYQASVDFVNEKTEEAAALIAEKGFIAKKEIAQKAIPKCNIVLYTGEQAEEGRSMLKTFNEIMFDLDPASVGGKLPDAALYY